MACRLFGAIIWTNDGILLIGHLGTKSSEIFIKKAFENVVCKNAGDFVSVSMC